MNPDAGLNLRLGFTSYALDATLNPDFSQVESDEGQVTVNERFALFFPEKRPFFLEGIELFGSPQTAELFAVESGIIATWVRNVRDVATTEISSAAAGAAAVVERFGSLKRAFALVRRVTDPAGWEAIRQRRTEDMLVYMALARFGKRPALSQLPGGLRADIRAFFGTYAKACRQADELLFCEYHIRSPLLFTR